MKKLIACLLVFVMLFSVYGCSKKEAAAKPEGITDKTDGKTICSFNGCDEEAVNDDSYGKAYCKKHLKNKKAFDASKDAYDNINSAYKIVDNMGRDIYEVWLTAIYNESDIEKKGAVFSLQEFEFIGR